jgi:hypothetical protein
MSMVPYSKEGLEIAERVAGAAAGQDGPLGMLAAWLIIIGAVILTASLGTIATIVLSTLIIPILALGVIWAVARNISGQSVGGYEIRQVALVGGPVIATILVLTGYWPFGLLVLIASVILAAA